MAKLHRFYVGEMDLTHDFWMKDIGLFHQWTRVLRFQVDRELVLFNSEQEERLYKIVKIGDDAIHLELVTELVANVPKKDVYLCFSLLKKDKNDWVLQKATELGVRHFVPMLCERTEKTGFDEDRAKKIVIEASEQCGRTDIPRVRYPITVESVIKELDNNVDIYVAEQGGKHVSEIKFNESIAILIGPEGGWTDSEKSLLVEKKIQHISLSEFTLRAETAAITAVALLQ